LLNFRTVPSLTFVHKFPISLCPFLILPQSLLFSPFPLEKLENLEKLEILQDTTSLFTTFSFLTPSFFTSKTLSDFTIDVRAKFEYGYFCVA
jgi:hypothetical protein